MNDRTEDCWNREGVGGDRSCERLRQHTHCRNCDTWAEGAARIMQRPLPRDYLRAWADHYAQPEQAHAASDMAALVFRVGPEWLSLPAALAVTVTEQAPVHRLPHRSGPILLGVVNIRGQLQPCFSLAALFGIAGTVLPARDKPVYPRLLTVRLQQQDCVLPVDELYGIHRYGRADLQPPPAGQELLHHVNALLPVQDMMVGCLDPDLLGRRLVGLLR